MTKNNNIIDFIKKNFSTAKNSVWREKDFAILLKEATRHNTYVETIKSDNLPDPDTLHLKVHQTGLESLHESFCELTEDVIRKVGSGKVIPIIDDTHEPYYGKTRNIYVHESKPKNGCKGSYEFLTAFLLIDEKKYFVDSIPISLFTDVLKTIEGILRRLEGLKIAVVLMDRGFANSMTISLLNRRGLKYLMLCKKDMKIKRIVRKTESYSRMSYYVKGIETTLVIVKNKFEWTFFTNLNYSNLFKYIRVYKKRWNIETGFRVQDEARIKTKCVDVKVRYFLFLIAMLLYNIWKKLKEVGVRMQFKRFLIEFFSVVR